MDKTEIQHDSILSIGEKYGCLTILDSGEEYTQSEKYLAYVEERESLINENLLYQSISDSKEKMKLLEQYPKSSFMSDLKNNPSDIDRIFDDFIKHHIFSNNLKLSNIESELETHYKCKCKCGKIHYYDERTIERQPKYCFYPVYNRQDKCYGCENVNRVYDSSECMPSDEYCDRYNTYKKKQLAKKEEKLRLEIEKFREKIDNLPRVKAENYDIDFVGKYYESLYIEECCDDYLENKPKPYYSYPSSMRDSEILILESEFKILRDIITAEDFTTDKQLLPIIQNFKNFKFNRVHITKDTITIHKKYKCKCILCGKEQYVNCDQFGIYPPTRYGITAYYGYWSNVYCDCHCISSFQWIVNKLLIENNVSYRVEYSFSDLYGVFNKNLLRFDFAILNDDGSLKCLIECQGEQHYMPVDEFGGETQYDIQVKNDELKREYAKKHNIQLIEISYKNKKYEKIEAILKEHKVI